ncbi:MAG: nickel-dependent lactate racemase [Promethearchaeota archaeon]|nr:MAG: nickel-dependent lactate racemase [Candidatus Lokiarchaeota archaeon]
MEIDLLYGSTGLSVKIPEDFRLTVIKSEDTPSLEDPVEYIIDKLEHPMNSQPLSQILAKNRKKDPHGDIVVLIDDHTRPISSKHFLDALSVVFHSQNIEDENVKILVSTGLHRRSTHSELLRMIGDQHLSRFDVLFHNANDDMNLERVGKTSSGNEVFLNSHYVQASFRIATGYVEPHFFSGYSGGRKAIVPGIAGKNTILHNHSPRNIHSKNARFGGLEENSLHEDMSEATRLLKPDFCINAILNRTHKITHIAAGNIFAVFNHLVQIQMQQCFKEIPHKYDIVICGNGGFPLDLNLYQAVKSMVIGELACKEGGVIISVNECRDGIGQESFKELINSGDTPDRIYNNALNGKINVPDVWEIQVMTRVLMHHSIYVVSSMNASELGNVGLKYAVSVEDAIEMGTKELEKDRKDIMILVLPDGPLVLPKIR